ncbi:MAG: HvfA family oxazolone/thioamide-modified RiPP metallophore [Chromatiales bacterium]
MRRSSPLIGVTLGAAVTVTAIAAASLVHATSPFQSIDAHGYRVADSPEGKCGEGKCGTNNAAADDEATREGKCGEGKCGADKKGETEAQGDTGPSRKGEQDG